MYLNVKLPPPFIYAYAVQKIQYHVNNQGIVVASGSPVQFINTVDIEGYLRREDVFMLGWQECHYEPEQTTIKGTLTERAKGNIITQRHAVNLDLLEHIKRIGSIENGQRVQFGVEVDGERRPIRSFEKILFDLGWNFKWEPRWPDEALGAEFPEEIRKALARQPEIQLLKLSLEQPPQQPVNPVKMEETRTVTAPSTFESTVLRALQNLQDRLTVLENAPSHPFGSGEPRPADAVGSAYSGDFRNQYPPAADYNGMEFSAPIP